MDLLEFIKAAGIKPKKKWDQFFLLDTSILDKEVELLELKEKDVVMEIGAGFGSLTLRLAQKCKVLAVEKDPELVQYVRRVKNTVAMCNDVIKILEEARRDERTGAFNKIAGNIPYSKSQQILIEIMRHPWQLAVVCVQKEFADKIGKKGEKLQLVVNDCCSVRKIMDIPAGKFYPEAVESAVILLEQKTQLDDKVWKLLLKLYRDKNKNVGNVVNCPVKMKKKKVHQLTMMEIRELANFLL